MSGMKLHTCQDWRRPHRRWKVVGFLISRKKMTHSPDVMSKIFTYVHNLASHHGKSMNLRWKSSERRILNRCKKRV